MITEHTQNNTDDLTLKDTYRLVYIDNNVEKYIDIKIAIPTMELQVKWQKVISENQKLMKDLIKNTSKISKEITERQLKIKENLTNVNADDLTIELALSNDNLLHLTKLTVNEINDLYNDRVKEREYFFRTQIEFLKLIIKDYELTSEQKKLIDSDYNSDFWRNVNMKQIENIINSFRTSYNFG